MCKILVMEYVTSKNEIKLSKTDDFNAKHILDCGQVFRFSKLDDKTYEVRVGDYQAIIREDDKKITINCSDNCHDTKFFENYFDLKTDYSLIKNQLSKYGVLRVAIESGQGLRILRAPFFETAINFIISANNNIKRIQLILNRLCEQLGENRNGYYTFPTIEKLLQTDESFWRGIGAGYRAKYLPKAIKQLADIDESKFEAMTTQEVRKKLISLAGIGPKVADCILLFGLQRYDSFPVDTWIEKLYYKHFDKTPLSRPQISKKLIEKFENLSGFAQQYIFNYRSTLSKTEDVI